MKIERMGRTVSNALAMSTVALLCACATIDEAGERQYAAQDSCPAASNDAKSRKCVIGLCEIHITLDRNGRPRIDPQELEIPVGNSPVQLIWDVPATAVFETANGDEIRFDDALPSQFNVTRGIVRPKAGLAETAGVGNTFSLTITSAKAGKYKYHALFRDARGEKHLHLCDPLVYIN